MSKASSSPESKHEPEPAAETVAAPPTTPPGAAAAPAHPDADATVAQAPPTATPLGDEDATLADGGLALRYAPEVERIGPYTVVGQFGRGAMGVVYHARNAAGEDFALKVLTETPLLRSDELSRFIREADASRLLKRHPNIITVYDTGSDGIHHYIAMEVVPDGRTIEAVISAEQPLAIQRAVTYGLAIARALAFAHENGIVHRDLKPANILINEFDQPLLADFGLAKTTESAVQLTMSGMVLGTPRYMSPEQARAGARNVTALSDIYSFGVVLYELVTGYLPYEISGQISLPEVFRIVVSVQARRPRSLRKDVSRPLEAVLLKLLEKEQSRRYQTMTAVIADLEAVLAGKPVSAHIPSWGERFERQFRRHKVLSVTIATAVSIILSLVALQLRESQESQGLLDAFEVSEAVNQQDNFGAAGTSSSDQTEGESAPSSGPELDVESDAELEAQLTAALQLLRDGQLAKAEPALAALAAKESTNGPQGYTLRARNELARIAMVRHDYAAAQAGFQAVADGYGRAAFFGQLAMFEAAAAAWMGKKATAKAVFEAICDAADTAGDLEKAPFNSYITLMAQVMAGRASAGDLLQEIDSFPGALAGFGFWVLAQQQREPAKVQAYLASARVVAGKQVIWLDMEDSQ